MKNIKTSTLGILFALLFISTVGSTHARADINDIRDSRVISARAGRVNFVSGDVRLRRAASLEWRALAAEDELKGGDTVTVGATGRVEILLNPGSYFRAGAGAEFTLAQAELDDLRVELARGSAVVEAMGYGDDDLAITVATPGATVRILRSGVYRVNALADGAAEVAVFEGRALLGATLVRGGRVARAGASGVELSKLDKKDRDELDLWSRERGRELAKANEKLQRRTLRTVFARNSFDNLFGGYSRGFWFYNDQTRCYTFVPFGYGWRSPYGYWYDTGVVIYPGAGGGWGWPGSPGNGGTGSGGGSNPPGGTFPGGGGGNSGGGGGTTPFRPSGGDVVVDRTPTAPRAEPRSSDRQPRRDQ
ncbi:MAG TPA: FecR domain-containing protein [Pyrinomonadaceae bacterium]|jgi:uncharacterized membrane protein YgcG